MNHLDKRLVAPAKSGPTNARLIRCRCRGRYHDCRRDRLRRLAQRRGSRFHFRQPEVAACPLDRDPIALLDQRQRRWLDLKPSDSREQLI